MFWNKKPFAGSLHGMNARQAAATLSLRLSGEGSVYVAAQSSMAPPCAIDSAARPLAAKLRWLATIVMLPDSRLRNRWTMVQLVGVHELTQFARGVLETKANPSEAERSAYREANLYSTLGYGGENVVAIMGGDFLAVTSGVELPGAARFGRDMIASGGAAATQKFLQAQTESMIAAAAEWYQRPGADKALIGWVA